MPPDIFYAIVGSNISRYRQNKKFTQEKLAQSISLDRTSISNIEQGRQKILLHSLIEIANALGVDPFELLPQKNVLSSNSESEYTLPKNLPQNEKTWLDSLILKKNENE